MLSPRDAFLSRRLALKAGVGWLGSAGLPGCGWLQDKPLSVAAHVLVDSRHMPISIVDVLAVTPAMDYRMLAGAAPELNGLVDASRLPTNGLLQ